VYICDTCHNVDKLSKHFAKWKQPDTNGHIFYSSISINYSE
jgi:hypothetical protein